MTNKGSKKGKKPLQTTLGKAPVQNEKAMDLSHVRGPIDTSIFGLRQVLSLLNTATDEVKNYITYECDIMYECRVCKTIFRSLANFILHKRSFCHEKYSPTAGPSNSPPLPQLTSNIELRNLQTQLLDTEKPLPTKGLLPVIDKLKEKQEINQLAKEIISKDFSNENQEVRTGSTINSDLLLEEIATTNAAVFQTILQDMPEQAVGRPELTKSEVLEIHGMLGSDEAVLGADGKVCTFETNKINSNPIIPKLKMECSECNMQFSTKKTLTFHLKSKHNNTSLVYVCPDCKETFSNSWCVYRHLYKIHRKTSAQVRRLRDQIHNGVIRKDCESNKKLEKEPEKLDKTDEENQWLNNMEGDNAFQMCGGCGKRFERKAALHSHATMCIKRIAVCNTIKENNAKKKEESKDTKVKATKTDKTVPEEVPAPVRGASKRKPYLLRTYKTVEKAPDVKTISDDSEKLGEETAKDGAATADDSESAALTRIKCFIENEENNTGCSSIKKPQTAGDFDLLCKSVLEHLKQNDRDEASEIAATKSDDIFVESINHEHQMMSPCRISIRSLEDLIGFSKEEQDQRATVKTPPPTRKRGQSPRSPKGGRSPRKSKRRRTRSLDLESGNGDFESDEQDLGFISRAAPYMDGLRLACRTCGTKYPTLSKLMCHMSAHFSWFRYQCSRCSFITFSKTDCAEHAEKVHNAGKLEIGGIVLPIPNWKTTLMSNEFRELVPDHDSIVVNTDDYALENTGAEEKEEAVEEEADDNIIDTLFIDSDAENAGFTAEPLVFPGPILGASNFIKTESIDIVDEDDTFKVELPDELYSVDVYDVVEIDSRENDRYGCRNEARVKTERRDSDDFVVPEMVSNVRIKTEDPVVNMRPIRNRMRSIKTLQDDFFYDLKGGKAVEVVGGKTNGVPKLKKVAQNVCARKEKSLRVYYKK